MSGHGSPVMPLDPTEDHTTKAIYSLWIFSTQKGIWRFSEADSS